MLGLWSIPAKNMCTLQFSLNALQPLMTTALVSWVVMPCGLLHTSVLKRHTAFIFIPKDGSRIFLLNAGLYPQANMVVQPRKPRTSPPREPPSLATEISLCTVCTAPD